MAWRSRYAMEQVKDWMTVSIFRTSVHRIPPRNPAVSGIYKPPNIQRTGDILYRTRAITNIFFFANY
jgi:hypothetical protein